MDKPKNLRIELGKGLSRMVFNGSKAIDVEISYALYNKIDEGLWDVLFDVLNKELAPALEVLSKE